MSSRGRHFKMVSSGRGRVRLPQLNARLPRFVGCQLDQDSILTSMKIAIITAGGAGMFCGSCMQDNTLARTLRLAGQDAILVPTYKANQIR